jgi:AcrR family transcriptional regulator
MDPRRRGRRKRSARVGKPARGAVRSRAREPVSIDAGASSQRRTPQGTAEKLVKAAAREFNRYGFSGTDTNRIARRAGFAPQTFYRWFRDKTDIFIKVYELWQQLEFETLQRLLAHHASDGRLARAVVAHHRAYLVFRRSLRQLSVENDQIRDARARGRLNQIRQIKSWYPDERLSMEDLAVLLLQFERLTDALAEGEIQDMGLDSRSAQKALALLIHRLRAPA